MVGPRRRVEIMVDVVQILSRAKDSVDSSSSICVVIDQYILDTITVVIGLGPRCKSASGTLRS